MTRRGIVWIAADVGVDGLVVAFGGYWDSGTLALEQMPMMNKAADAIRWGLDRTDDVRIRFDGWDYFWAGKGPVPAGSPPLAGTITLRE